MRPHQIALAAATLALSFQAADALAVTCYEIIDKDQNVTYRSSQPPFGMDGEDWTRSQDQLRARNLHLRWQSQNDCAPSLTMGKDGARAALPKSDSVFDPSVILQSTPEYMTGSGRPNSVTSSSRR